jgi:hypothetical protein
MAAERIYEIALPQQAALDEWREFVESESMVSTVGEVRFEATAANRSRLCIADRRGVGADAVVQRFRERLKNKRLMAKTRLP